jgi:putative oxidoreductase
MATPDAAPVKGWISEGIAGALTGLALLVLRLAVGAMMLSLHGWKKLSGFGEIKESFPDPLGIGSMTSLTLATGAEFFCSILVILGLLTRLAVLPLIATMAVAALVFHADDPWSKKELAILYLIPFFTLLLAGGGKFSLDALIFKRRGAK